MPDSPGLYMPDGSFQPFDAQGLATELATRESAGDLSAFTGDALGILPDPDPVLRERGDDAAILADLAADDQVSTAMLSRKNRVMNKRDFAFTPGTPGQKAEADAGAKLLCDRLVKDMERWVFSDLVAGILNAPFYGFTPLELMWRPEGAWWRLVDVTPKPARWFGFDPRNNAPVWRGANLAGISLLPPNKFVFARHFPDYDNPYGIRLLSRCLWPVAFKKGGIQFYVRFVEKYGQPWTVGTAPAKAKAHEKQAMARDLARMVRDAAAVIPHGANVQLVSPQGQPGDLHESFLKRWDAAISKVLMGQTLTAEIGERGSYAASETHKEVADDIAVADANLVESALNEIAWLYAQVNDPASLCPVFAYKDEEDLAARADLDNKLYSVGVDFTAEHFEKTYKLDPGSFTVRPRQVPASFAAPASSAPQATHPAIVTQNALDAAVDAAMPEALKSSEDFCTELENALGKAETPEDAELLLAEFMAARPEALEAALTNMMLGAAMLGRASVKAESKAGE